MACAQHAKCARLDKVQFMMNNLREPESRKCGQGWPTRPLPSGLHHKAIKKNSVLTCAMICTMFCKLFWGSANVHTTQKVLAAGQQWVPNWMRPQNEHQNMHVISMITNIVLALSKSEGLLKWLASCGTDVRRVAHTIDGCIFSQTSSQPN
jgi:hypothetical protein